MVVSSEASPGSSMHHARLHAACEALVPPTRPQSVRLPLPSGNITCQLTAFKSAAAAASPALSGLRRRPSARAATLSSRRTATAASWCADLPEERLPLLLLSVGRLRGDLPRERLRCFPAMYALMAVCSSLTATDASWWDDLPRERLRCFPAVCRFHAASRLPGGSPALLCRCWTVSHHACRC